MTAPRADKYAHIVRAVRDTPWAIHPPTLATILDIVAFRAEGNKLTEEEITERLAAASHGPRAGARTVQGARPGGTGKTTMIAVLPIYGVISPRQNLVGMSSGGTSLDLLAQDFRMALTDPTIDGIVFDIDSPGGMVDGIDEFASEIRAARGQKPIVAVANYMAASAAYYLAAQADELVVSPSGQVGSIGVLTAHQDFSAMYEQLGVKTTLIAHGKYKTEGNQYEPLSEEAQAEMQSKIDTWGEMFEAAVAKGRGVPVSTVREDYGQGRMALAKAAVAAGMADRVDTLDNTIRRVAGGRVKSGQAEGAAALGSWQSVALPSRSDHAHALAPVHMTEAEEDATTLAEVLASNLAEKLDEEEQEPEAPTDTPALVTGSTTARLEAVTAEVADLAAIAQSRAQRRTDRRSPLSAAHKAEFEAIEHGGLEMARQARAVLDQAQGATPAGTVKPGANLDLMIAAYERGYSVDQLQNRKE